jgi:hypothetical protein
MSKTNPAAANINAVSALSIFFLQIICCCTGQSGQGYFPDTFLRIGQS